MNKSRFLVGFFAMLLIAVLAVTFSACGQEPGKTDDGNQSAEYTITIPDDNRFTIVFSEEATDLVVAENSSFSFVINMSEGYDGSELEVKSNNEVVSFTDGAFRIDNVSANQIITVDNVLETPEILITVDGLAPSYTGEPQSPVITTDPENAILEYATDGENPVWSSSIPTFTDVGTYKIYVKATCPGYRTTLLDSGNGKEFTIMQTFMSGIEKTVQSGTYDGNVHIASLSNLPAGATATYSVNDGEYSEEVPSFVDVGRYSIGFRVTSPNYYEYNDVSFLEIDYASIDGITVESFYGKANQETGSITVNGTVSGDKIEYKTDGEWSEINPAVSGNTRDGAAVEYRVTRNTNYRASGTGYVYTVPMNDTFSTVQSNNYSYTYNGDAKKVSLSGTEDHDTVYYRESSEDEWAEGYFEKVNAGTYASQFMVARPGEGICIGDATLTIEKADYTFNDIAPLISNTSFYSIDVKTHPTLSTLTLPENFSWLAPDTALSTAVNGAEYSYKYNRDSQNYNDFTYSIKVYACNYYTVSFELDGCTYTLSANSSDYVAYNNSCEFTVQPNAEFLNCKIYAAMSEGENDLVPIAENNGVYYITGIKSNITVKLTACYLFKEIIGENIYGFDLIEDESDELGSIKGDWYINRGGQLTIEVLCDSTYTPTVEYSIDNENWTILNSIGNKRYQITNVSAPIYLRASAVPNN